MILRAARSPDGLAEVRRLLAAGASPDECARDGLTALQLACGRDDEAMVRELLAARADATACNFRRRFAIHEACADGGHEAIVSMLVAHGASAAVADVDGNTPLHTLMGSRRISSPALVPLLLAAGAPPDARNADGLTPLHVACTQGHADAARLLLAAGADVHARCKLGSPLALCVWARVQAPVQEALLAAGAAVRGETLLHLALRAADHSGQSDDSVHALRRLISLGCDVEEADERGARPLHVAVLHRRVSHVVALLEAGADPLRVDDLGVSSLALCRSVLAHSPAPALVAILALLLFAAGRPIAPALTLVQLETLAPPALLRRGPAAVLAALRGDSAPKKLP